MKITVRKGDVEFTYSGSEYTSPNFGEKRAEESHKLLLSLLKEMTAQVLNLTEKA